MTKITYASFLNLQKDKKNTALASHSQKPLILCKMFSQNQQILKKYFFSVKQKGFQVKVFFFILSLLFVNCSKNDEDQAKNTPFVHKILSNQFYGENLRNTMDLFLPANSFSKEKAVILIHGGGWCEGDKTDFYDFGNILADSGITTVAINYRHADSLIGINYQHILTDINNAIIYLQNNKEAFNCNFNKITLWGMIAGAHLALLFGYKINTDNCVENVISLAGPTHLTDCLLLNIPGMSILLNNLIGSMDDSLWQDASPINYQSDITTYLYHGKLDTIVPYQQSEQLFEQIQTANPNNKMVIFNDCGHDFTEDAFLQVVIESIDLIKK